MRQQTMRISILLSLVLGLAIAPGCVCQESGAMPAEAGSAADSAVNANAPSSGLRPQPLPMRNRRIAPPVDSR
jgi:hypothetical protein